jgi:Diacylglycerol kinase catalytic domain
VAATRIILHGKAAGDARVRTAVHAVRQNGHPVEVRVTWEPGDAARLTAEAIVDAGAGAGKVSCIVAGGGDGTSTRYLPLSMARVCRHSVLLASYRSVPRTILLTRQACRSKI